MKKTIIMILVLVAALASCKKTPEVNLKYVDVERDLVTVGTTTANIQCDYEYIATLKKAYLYYGESEDEANMNVAEMRVVQKTLYVELIGLKENTTYHYYYEFHNGFNSMRTAQKSFKTETSPASVTLPTVITAEVSEITATSAKGGGEVTNDGGAEVTERGICWSANANPTLSDSHVAAGSGTGAFTAMMENLETNTTYHVRAYAINEKGTAYGLDREFVTDGGGSGEHEWVDLGLPSGTLWATCNVGANSPEEYGDYFAWGEIEPRTIFPIWDYKYSNGDEFSMTKYCNNSNYGYNGFIDDLVVLEPSDDAAFVHWGGDWCMPTKEMFSELLENTTYTWTTLNGIKGGLYTASNGNSVFLPAGGVGGPGGIGFLGTGGYYWSRSLKTEEPCYGRGIHFRSDYSNLHMGTRDIGCSVRPVRKTETPTPPGNAPEGAINGLFTINANGDQVYFSQGNLQYQASTNTWRFAENQWDYIGNGNSNISEVYNGWIDLFGWGTSGWNNGNLFYQPFNAEGFMGELFYMGLGYGPTDETNYNYNLTGTYANADWGINNAISNGGNLSNLWRTLSSDEWNFVFLTRLTTSTIRYAKAAVNNECGVILLPDNWDPNIYTLNNPNESEASFTCNVLNSDQWAVLEDAGAVFFPASGIRNERTVNSVGSEGFYWSTTACGTAAYNMAFHSIAVCPDSTSDRCYGFSVRLVHDANP